MPSLPHRDTLYDYFMTTNRSVHAFSFWHGETPYILLTTDTSGEKGRFDAAHVTDNGFNDHASNAITVFAKR